MADKKKCAKCGTKFEGEEAIDQNFGSSETSTDGYQSYCRECKNALGKRRRQKNVSARLRHHIATRVAAQLGDLTPPNHTTKLDELLGYSLRQLTNYLSQELKQREGHTRKLRDALDEGYHVDHIVPLSSFKVIQRIITVGEGSVGEAGVDWETFRKCWAQSNLRAIPAEENLAKGATMIVDDPNDSSNDPEKAESVRSYFKDSSRTQEPDEKKDNIFQKAAQIFTNNG